MLEDVPALFHQLKVGLSGFAMRQVVLDFLAEDVVRAHEVILGRSVVPDHAVAVGYAGEEVARLVSESFFKRAYKLGRFGSRDFVGAVVKHRALAIGAVLLGEGDDVAPVGGVLGAHIEPH